MYRSVLGGFLVAIAALAGPNAADATATLWLSADGGATFTQVQDGGIGDLNPAAGVVLFSGSVGVFPLLSDEELESLRRRAAALFGPEQDAIFGDALYQALLANTTPPGLGATGSYSQNWLPDR